MADNDPDHYAILGVPSDATQDEIEVAYRLERRKWHPDAHPPEEKKIAEEHFKRIGQAYAVLGDKHCRKEYDDSLRPRLIFRPSLVDFGDILADDPTRRVTVQLHNIGGPLRTNEFKEPANGPFWLIRYGGDISDEEWEDDHTLLLRFDVELGAGLGLVPDEYTGVVHCSFGKDSAELHIRANIVAKPASTYSASTHSGRSPFLMAPPSGLYTTASATSRSVDPVTSPHGHSGMDVLLPHFGHRARWLLVAAVAGGVPYLIMTPIILTSHGHQTGFEEFIAFLCGVSFLFGMPYALIRAFDKRR